MRQVLGIIVLASSLCSIAVQAMDQEAAIDAVASFVQLKGAQLHEGTDEQGHCRVLIYGQAAESRDIWFEGTFQQKTGPVLGLAIPFMLSSSPEMALIESFRVSEGQISAEVAYPSQGGETRIQLTLRQDRDGHLSDAIYVTSSAKRICANLRRVL
ncbi:MAG: hypothetical protein A2X94_04735 [Bdellovibrionales bacterium GWB1_55_8]|nr:MAG: hypothetical protein A2X94_04735 [Bdellovibrionales bacterium GWB1_55_8]